MCFCGDLFQAILLGSVHVPVHANICMNIQTHTYIRTHGERQTDTHVCMYTWREGEGEREREREREGGREGGREGERDSRLLVSYYTFVIVLGTTASWL